MFWPSVCVSVCYLKLKWMHFHFLYKAPIVYRLTNHWYNLFFLFFSIAAHLNGPIFQSMDESTTIFAVYCLWHLSTLCNGPSNIPIHQRTFPSSNHPGYINDTQWIERYTMDQWTATPLCWQMDIQEAVRQLENHWKLSEKESRQAMCHLLEFHNCMDTYVPVRTKRHIQCEPNIWDHILDFLIYCIPGSHKKKLN